MVAGAADSCAEAEGYEVRTHDQPFGSTNAIVQYQPDLVLLYSSNDEDSLRAAARRLQLDDYICKGNLATLRLRVAAILSR